MKSKNMVLMVVAVGCGLVAAYLTAKISGGSSQEMVEVIVAKEQLQQGTEIKTDKEGLEKQLQVKRFPKGTEPASFIRDVEELKGKKLNKTIRQGDHFTEADITTHKTFVLPEGTCGLGVKVTPESVAGGLVIPSSRVNVILAEGGQDSKPKQSALVLADVLVVAVNTDTAVAEGKDAVSTPNTVTLAVTPEQASILLLAQKRGDLTLLLRDSKNEKSAKEDWGYAPVVKLPFEKGAKAPEAPAAPPPETFDFWVAKGDYEAGTKVEDPDSLFERKRSLDPVDSAVTDPTRLKGVTLTKSMLKGQTVTTAHLEGEVERKGPAATSAPAAPAVPTSTLTIVNGQNSRSYSFNKNTNEVFGVGGPVQARPATEEKSEPKDAPAPSRPEKDSK